MKKIVIRNCSIIVFVLIILAVSLIYYHIVNIQTSKQNGFTLVLDAGHGARDGGSVGVNGTVEKEINLTYTLALKDKLIENGYKVELTRKDDNPLYSEFAKNKKVSDMNKRMEIIKKANPNLVVSIHMNSFSDKTVCGATCYYKINDEASKKCADLIQKSLSTYCNSKVKEAKGGDFFMLNCSYYTSVLIECGYLSNPQEEMLLNSDEYRNKIIEAVYSGIMLYFGNV